MYFVCAANGPGGDEGKIVNKTGTPIRDRMTDGDTAEAALDNWRHSSMHFDAHWNEFNFNVNRTAPSTHVAVTMEASAARRTIDRRQRATAK